LSQELEDDPRYWIDFPALGCCAFTLDKGIETEIQSEHLPACVYSREQTKT